MSKDDEWVTVDGVRYEPRDKIIEECARVAEQTWVIQEGPATEVAAAIRALQP